MFGIISISLVELLKISFGKIKFKEKTVSIKKFENEQSY